MMKLGVSKNVQLECGCLNSDAHHPVGKRRIKGVLGRACSPRVMVELLRSCESRRRALAFQANRLRTSQRGKRQRARLW